MTISTILQIAGMFLIPFITVLIPVVIGRKYGIYMTKKSTDVNDRPIGSVVGASFTLLGFMMAFTFHIVINRYDARKQLLLEETTNIRTTYLRTGLIPEPLRSISKNHLVDYVDLRVELATDPSKLDHILLRSQEILDSLWMYAESINQQDRNSEAYALYTTSVNNIVDLYNQRITMTLQYRIPPTLLWLLFIIAFFCMILLGYHFGISGLEKRNFNITVLLAVIFSLVMFIILALNKPETGVFKLNQKQMFALQKQLREHQTKK